MWFNRGLVEFNYLISNTKMTSNMQQQCMVHYQHVSAQLELIIYLRAWLKDKNKSSKFILEKLLFLSNNLLLRKGFPM